METVLQTQWNSSHRQKMHRNSKTRNLFKVSATSVPDLDQNRKRFFINNIIPCSGKVLPKDQTLRETTSHKQITNQYANVCHVFKTFERETVHDPSQIATWSNLLCKRRKFTNELLIIDQLAKDPPCSLNRDHGPIGC